MKGAYVLIIEISETVDIQIQSLGNVSFQPGSWIYVGSAMGAGSTNLENRIKRHFRSEKTLHWHIDHLLDKNVKLIKAYWVQSQIHAECTIAQGIQASKEFQAGPRGFGSSDCTSGCSAHIFRFKNVDGLENVIVPIIRQLGLEPSVTTNGFLNTST
ncbi:MAG: GIY-YIG nuclease family protein [Candidatus Thorarchaeota archaeon]|jgi:Uri superfamily endonuclease